jgi:hypothetical protein
MLMVVSQKVRNAAKSIVLVGLSPQVNQPCILCKEACAVNDANTNVNDVIIWDGMLGEFGKRCSLELACDKEFEPLCQMTFQGHGGAIGFAIVSRCVAALCDKPGKYLMKSGVGVFHPDMFVYFLKATGTSSMLASMRVEFVLITSLLHCVA